MEKLSSNFSWAEALKSDKAVELGIENIPDPKVTGNIIVTASKLEEIRKLTGPLVISSWYRSEVVNRAIGGVTQSAHCSGYAVDCHSKVMTPLELCKLVVKSGIQFDQVIHEYGRWMHISFDPRMRGMTLTKFDKGYLVGLLTEAQYQKKK